MFLPLPRYEQPTVTPPPSSSPKIETRQNRKDQFSIFAANSLGYEINSEIQSAKTFHAVLYFLHVIEIFILVISLLYSR